MNQNYLNLLASRGITPNFTPNISMKVQPLVNTPPTTPQVPIREQGFGNHFKDAPPSFMEETKTDNKIERLHKPKPKKKKRRKVKK